MNAFTFVFSALKKTNKTTWLILTFSFLIINLAFISELFQNITQNQQSADSLSSPFHPSFLPGVKHIALKNRLIEIELEKKSLDENKAGTWMLSKPRSLAANQETIKTLFDSLSNLRLRKVIEKDQINLSNFSLNTPTVRLTLTDALNETSTLLMGMINPIDNTAYITLEDSSQIFQIEILNFPIERLGLSDFVESKLISLDLKELIELNLYYVQGKNRSRLIGLTKTGDSWTNPNDVLLSNEKVDEYLGKIFNLRSQMILDEIPAGIANTIRQISNNTNYTLELRDKHDNKKSYHFSGVITSDIAELKLQGQRHIIVHASDREHPYIVDKAYLDYFSIRDKELTSKSSY